jgi:hypothetical protein
VKLGLIKPKPRVTDAPGPGLWIGAYRRIAGPTHEVVETPLGDEVENRPPQYLLAAWKPLRRGEPFPRRFPALAELAAAEEASVAEGLLKRLPDGARLAVPRFDVDWALVAQIVMVTDDRLSAAQHQMLQAFIESERRQTLTTIGTHYSQDAKGTERFADTEAVDPESAA